MRQSTEAVATRIDAESAAKIEQAAEECGITKSAYLRIVVRDHIERNPDGLRAFEDGDRGDLDDGQEFVQGEDTKFSIDQMMAGLE